MLHEHVGSETQILVHGSVRVPYHAMKRGDSDITHRRVHDVTGAGMKVQTTIGKHCLVSGSAIKRKGTKNFIAHTRIHNMMLWASCTYKTIVQIKCSCTHIVLSQLVILMHTNTRTNTNTFTQERVCKACHQMHAVKSFGFVYSAAPGPGGKLCLGITNNTVIERNEG